MAKTQTLTLLFHDMIEIKKIIFSKQLFCLLLILHIYFAVCAQPPSPLPEEEHEVPHPMNQIKASFYPDIKQPVRSFTWVIDKDTILRKFYDPSGNLISNIGYHDNQPRYKSIFTNKGSLCTESRHYTGDILGNTNAYTYDQNGNLLKWLGSTFVYDKKTKQSTEYKDRNWIVEWNDAKHMKRRYSLNDPNKRTQQSDYTYNASGQLTEIRAEQWKDVYEYQDSLLVHKSRIFYNGNVVTYSGTFSYNNEGRLSRSADNYYVTTYNYDNTGTLTHMLMMKSNDTTKQQEAIFHYKGKSLAEVQVTCNDSYMVYAATEFITNNKVNYLSADKTKKLTMTFLYDSHDNITEIKFSVNGQYGYSKFFLYDYY